MNQTQTVIVYRNPADQYFWESGLIVPILFASIALAVSVVLVDKLMLRLFSYGTYRNLTEKWWPQLWGSIVIGAGVFAYFY